MVSYFAFLDLEPDRHTCPQAFIFKILNQDSIWRSIVSSNGFALQEVAEASRQLAAIAKRRFMSSKLHFIYEVQAA